MHFTNGKVQIFIPMQTDPLDFLTEMLRDILQLMQFVLYYPFTTLKGVIEKNTGVEPFDAPNTLVELYNKKDYGKWKDAKLNDVPVAFTHICDLTGGSSGSPVMNSKGELVGIAFDGNYEAMISDWQFDQELQRAISVDIRYVLFITQKYSKADFLLDEMGVKQ